MDFSTLSFAGQTSNVLASYCSFFPTYSVNRCQLSNLSSEDLVSTLIKIGTMVGRVVLIVTLTGFVVRYPVRLVQIAVSCSLHLQHMRPDFGG
jgi:hypothetical protein